MLRSRTEIAEAFGVTPMSVSHWAKESDCPIRRKGRGFEVEEAELREWCKRTGKTKGAASKSTGPRKVSPKPPPASPENTPRPAAAPALAELLDPKVLEDLPPFTGSIDDDIDTARRTAHKLRGVVAAFKLDALDDPQMARIFGQYTEILSKCLGRLSKLEADLLDLKQKRSELLSVEDAQALLAAAAASFVAHIDGHGRALLDTVKDAELAVYGESRIDSDRLQDEIELLGEEFRERVAEDLAESQLQPDEAEAA